MLSSPILTAMNNEPAVMRVGMRTSQDVPDGVALSVTPQISADGIIHITVSASVAGETVVRETDSMFRVRQGEMIVIAGLGLLLSFPAGRLVRSSLFGIAPADPVTYLLIPAVLLTVALLSSWLPARRATRVDPVISLRSE